MFLVGNDKKVVEVENAKFYVDENGKIAELLPCTFYVDANGKIAELLCDDTYLMFTSRASSDDYTVRNKYKTFDGVNWEVTSDSSVPWMTSTGAENLTYGDGKIIMYNHANDGSRYCYLSEDDGETWTQYSIDNSESFSIITYYNGYFFASGRTRYKAYSTDGKTWTKFSSDNYNTYWLDGAYGKSFSLQRNNSSTNTIYLQSYILPTTSYHTRVSAGTNTDSIYDSSMIYGNGYLATCIKGETKSRFSYWVDNGESGGSLTQIISASNFKAHNIVYGNGNFIVYGDTGYYKSTDGTPLTLTTLTAHTWGSYDHYVLRGAMFFKDRFVSLNCGSSGSNNGYLYYSTDGIVWTKTSTKIPYMSNYTQYFKYSATMNKDGGYDHEI